MDTTSPPEPVTAEENDGDAASAESRNADLSFEFALADMFDRRRYGRELTVDEKAARREVRERHRASLKDASVCGRCGKAIARGAGITRIRNGAKWVDAEPIVACQDCTDELGVKRFDPRCAACGASLIGRVDGEWVDNGIYVRSEKGVYYRMCRWCGFDKPQPCVACGRSVLIADKVRRQYVTCSEECRRVAARARRARRDRSESRNATCQQCGEEFEPARSDAAYCSSACRQRAYRLRKKENDQ